MKEKLQNWINWILYDELMDGKINAPKHLLGNHDYGDGQVITCFKPHSQSVSIKTPSGKKIVPMEKISEEGFYGAYFPKKRYNGSNYRLVTEYYDGTTVESADCYSYDGLLTDYDAYLFAEGKNYDIYNKMGAHPMTIDGVKGTYFAVWAPDARRVSVVGDFNMWDGSLNPMQIHSVSGIYELFIPDVLPGAVYKFQILTRYGDILSR